MNKKLLDELIKVGNKNPELQSHIKAVVKKANEETDLSFRAFHRAFADSVLERVPKALGGDSEVFSRQGVTFNYRGEEIIITCGWWNKNFPTSDDLYFDVFIGSRPVRHDFLDVTSPDRVILQLAKIIQRSV